MLNKENFKEALGTWYKDIEPLFDDGTMDTIFSELKKQSKEGIAIAPESHNTFRCFLETPRDQCKVVFMGLCPYHTVINNKMVADGILMSCSNHADYIAPSLDQYYGAVEEEFKEGLCLPCVKTGDLTFLAHQGVLMYNAALTTKIGKAKFHQKLWKPFTEHMMLIFTKLHLPVIYLGAEAWDFNRGSHLDFKLSHPASASYKGGKWDSEGVFTKVNNLLDSFYQQQIKWILDNPPF